MDPHDRSNAEFLRTRHLSQPAPVDFGQDHAGPRRLFEASNELAAVKFLPGVMKLVQLGIDCLHDDLPRAIVSIPAGHRPRRGTLRRRMPARAKHTVRSMPGAHRKMESSSA